MSTTTDWCSDMSRHRRWGMHSSLDGVAHCSVCSPEPSPPLLPEPEVDVVTGAEVDVRKPIHITSSTGETDPAVLERMYGKRRR